MTPNPEHYGPFQSLMTLLNQQDQPERKRMARAFTRTSHWRQRLLLNTFRARQGNTVFAGPFAGMTYLDAAEGALLPRLIGCYEAELHPAIGQLQHEGYQDIIDIGCAEGYYAVGLARMLPDCRIFAHDISEAAQTACRALAQTNGVADRIRVGGVFDGHSLTQHQGRKTLVICDIEGAEDELLDPAKYPAWADVDLIVEVHECYRSGLIDRLNARFGATHDIEWIWPSASARRPLPAWTQELSHLDQLLCTWEWREGATPWAVMRSHALHPHKRSAALPVVFALHDADGRYWLNTAVAMTSVLEHSRCPLQLHLLHDDTLRLEARERLTRIARDHGATLQLHAMQLPASIDAGKLHRFSPASLYRLMIPQLLAREPLVVYLDSDLVSHGVDVGELARALPAQAPIGGVVDPYIGEQRKARAWLESLGLKAQHYMNSGVLVLRPPMVREDLLAAFVQFNLNHPDAIHPDQDFLNLHFGHRWARLDARFNTQLGLFERSLFQPLSHYQGKILHYAGKLKPLEGNLAPGMLPFWMYTHATPEVGQIDPTMRYLSPIQGQAHAIHREPAELERPAESS